MFLCRRRFVAALAACGVAPGATVAGNTLARPTGDVLLTVTGSIGVTNVDDAAAFDRAMLEAPDWVDITTHTSFTSGPQRFAGPTLVSLLDAVGARGKTISATAVNDYTIKFPVDHARAHDVILAMDKNGKPMRVRDKGPIWVVYPLSEADAEMRPFDSQMIWQLARIRID